ncbi:ABC transporter substrate-binding protein [Methanolacinia petrolearia]|uniref:ABC transporter substrate-binding protein n=1 Tax=Methanolacinia petrolearia TaxID=54120 RepID=UPI003BACDBAD
MGIKNKDLKRFCILAVVVLIAAAIAVLAFSWGPEESSGDNNQAGPAAGSEKDYFSSKALPEYAEGFEVEYHDNYKVLSIIDPWGRESGNRTYLLVQKGTEVPAGYDDAAVFYIPVESVAALSTTQIPHIANIGEIDTIQIVSNIQYINNPEIIDRYDEGLIRDVSTADSSMTSGLDAEILIDAEPDAVFVSAMENPDYDDSSKIRELGLKPALVSEYMEKTPLARAEWIKYFSLFYNREEEANALFDEIVSRYDNASAKAKGVSEKTTVFSGNDYYGTWYMPGGESYVAQLIEDAGADYLWSDDNSTGSIPLDFEAVYDTAADADYWINMGTANTAGELLAEDERYSKFDAFQNDSIYNNNARVNEFGGNDYWESGVARPDLVLMDLIKIFHPDILPDHELYYYRHIE